MTTLTKLVKDIEVGDLVVFCGVVKSITKVEAFPPTLRFTFRNGSEAIFREEEKLSIIQPKDSFSLAYDPRAEELFGKATQKENMYGKASNMTPEELQAGDVVFYGNLVTFMHTVKSVEHRAKNTVILTDADETETLPKGMPILVYREEKKCVYILWFTDPNSYHSTRDFKGVFETIEGATEAIPERFRDEKDRMPAEGDTVVQFYGFEVKRTELGA